MEIVSVKYPGHEEFFKNISEYVEQFLRGEVIAFRGANCSAEEQLKIMQALGDELNWWPNTVMSGPRGSRDPFYYETHHQNMNENKTANKDSLMLGWHLEHVELDSEQYVGAAWSMNLFDCDPDSGKTMFVDVAKVFESLDPRDQAFLHGAETRLIPMDEESPASEKYKFVQPHWYLEIPVPRAVLNGSHVTELVSIHGKTANDEEKARFTEIFNRFVYEVTENKDNRWVHSWQKGDLLILDVFRLAHAITGGFDKNQRTLKGIFGIIAVE